VVNKIIIWWDNWDLWGQDCCLGKEWWSGDGIINEKFTNKLCWLYL